MRVRAKAPRLCAGDGGAYGRRIPLEGIVVESSLRVWFRVKTLVRFFGLGNDDVTRRYPSGGVVVELRGLFVAASIPGVKLRWLRHGMTSPVSYLLHVTSLSPFSVLAVCWQDRRSTARSEGAGGPLQQWLGVFGATLSDDLIRRRGFGPAR